MSDQDHWLDQIATLLLAEKGTLDELARLVGYDPATFYVGTDTSGLKHSDNEIKTSIATEEYAEHVIKENIHQLMKLKHQGNRFSKLVALAYKYPDYLIYILSEVSEVTLVGKSATSIFFLEFASKISSENDNVEIALTLSLDRALTRVHHLNRGLFFYYLAADLGYISHVAGYLKAKLKKNTWSMSRYRTQILAELEEWEDQRKGSQNKPLPLPPIRQSDYFTF